MYVFCSPGGAPPCAAPAVFDAPVSCGLSGENCWFASLLAASACETPYACHRAAVHTLAHCNAEHACSEVEWGLLSRCCGEHWCVVTIASHHAFITI